MSEKKIEKYNCKTKVFQLRNLKACCEQMEQRNKYTTTPIHDNPNNKWKYCPWCGKEQ